MEDDTNTCAQSQQRQRKEEEIKQQRMKMENVMEVPIDVDVDLTHHPYHKVPTSPQSPIEELTWDDAADICAPWSGDGVLGSVKEMEEVVSNNWQWSEESNSRSSSCHQHKKHEDQASRSPPSESNTYTVAPSSSTPTSTSCRSQISLPSPILPTMDDNDNRKDVKVGVSFDVLQTRRRNSSPSYTSTRVDDSKMTSSWQTTGVTRSEVEYQARKKDSSSSPADDDDPSYIEVRVVSRPKGVPIRQDKPPQVVPTNGRDNRQGSASYSNSHDQLDEVRRLDYKISGVMQRLHDDVEYERSKMRKSSSSSSAASTMCKVVREYDKYLEMYPLEDDIGSGALGDHIHTHLMKIRHQIKLVEKYNRALLEKEAERSRNPKTKCRITEENSSKNYSSNPRSRGNARVIPAGEEQRSKYKTEDASIESIKSEDSGGSSYDQYKTGTSNNFSRYSNGIGTAPKNIKLGVDARVRRPGSISSVADASQIRNSRIPRATAHSRMPATIAYERWTWPNGRQMSAKSIHEGPMKTRKTGGQTSDQEASAGRHSDRENRNNRKDDTQRGNGGGDRSGRRLHVGGRGNVHDDSRRLGRLTEDQMESMACTDSDDQTNSMGPGGCINKTFRKTEPCDENRNRRRVFDYERLTDEEELQLRSRSRDRRTARKSRTILTITDNDSKIRDQDIQGMEPVTHALKQDANSVPVPRKSVAFYVPLFCGNCEDTPVECKNSNEGAGYDCQKKFKWFCDTKGENGLYDVKGPVGIQECFKDARCSGPLLKRSSDLLSSRFERMSTEDKLYLGMLTKNLNEQEAASFLRNQCHFEEDELMKRFTKYLEMRSKDPECLDKKKSRERKATVITMQEMRERTARLRGNDFIQQEKQRKEEQRQRRAANRLMQSTYALKIRKSLQGNGKNIYISSNIKM
ncbi:unnamed protein product [Orchesella dallaii]|uniref:Uncharacterized protein n=1 Tax=Orchesella dallaii TaxID=48710 RepID=A0ABP1S8J8_9HEXA